MGTTRIKVIDLSSGEKEIKTSRKHAEKLAGFPAKEKAEKENKQKETAEKTITTESTSEGENQLQAETAAVEEKPSKTKTSKKTRQSHHLGKKYQQARNLIENKLYTKDEAFELLPKTSITKFDPTVEIHLNVADKNIKGSVAFPHLKTTQKEKKYLIFSDKNIDTKKNVIWANENTITDIEKGALKVGKDFDTVISTPKYMPSLTKVAKILGPKGLMPNPKNGTITENIQKVLEDSGSENLYSFKCDPTAPIIHTKIGKLSQKESELKENLKTLVVAIGPSKIRNATLTTSMGPGIKLNISTL